MIAIKATDKAKRARYDAEIAEWESNRKAYPYITPRDEGCRWRYRKGKVSITRSTLPEIAQFARSLEI